MAKRFIFWGVTSLLALLFSVAQVANANGKGCKLTVYNQSVVFSMLVGFSQPVPNQERNLLKPGTSEVFMLKPGARKTLYVHVVAPGQGVHRGQIEQADMGRDIDCSEGRAVDVTIKYNLQAGWPNMTIAY